MLKTEEKSEIFSCGLFRKTTQGVFAVLVVMESVYLHNWRGRGKLQKYAGTEILIG